MSTPSSAASPASSLPSPQARAPSPDFDLWDKWRKEVIDIQIQLQCERDGNALQLKNEQAEPVADYLHSRPVVIKLFRYGFSSAQFLLTSIYDVYRSRATDNDAATVLFVFVTLCSVGSFLSSSVASPWLEAKSWEEVTQPLQLSVVHLEQKLSALAPNVTYPFTLSPIHVESLQQRVAALHAIPKPEMNENLLTRNLLATFGCTLIGFVLTLSGKLIPDETVSTIAPVFYFFAAVSFLVGDRLQLLRLKRKELQAREELLYTLQAQLSPRSQIAVGEAKQQAPADPHETKMQGQIKNEGAIQGAFTACFKRLMQDAREAYVAELHKLLRQLPGSDVEEKGAEQQPITDETITHLKAKLQARRQEEAFNRVAERFGTAQSNYKGKLDRIVAGADEELNAFKVQLEKNMHLQFDIMNRYEVAVREYINFYRKESKEGHAVEHALTQPHFLPR